MPRNRLVVVSAATVLAFMMFASQRLQASDGELRTILSNLESAFAALDQAGQRCPVREPYDAVAAMQRECNKADEIWARQSSSASTSAEDAKLLAKMHAIMKSAAIIIDYPDLYDLHDQLLRRYLANAGYVGGVLSAILDDKINGKNLYERYQFWEETRANGSSQSVTCEFTLDQSKRLGAVTSLTISGGAPTSPCGNERRFGEALTLQLREPIVQNYFIKYYRKEAESLGIEIHPEDYFEAPMDRKDTAEWIRQKAADFEHQPVIHLKSGIWFTDAQQESTGQPNGLFHVPVGVYSIYVGNSPGVQGSPLKVAKPSDPAQILHFLWRVEGESLVEVTATNPEERPSARSMVPRFELLDFRLGTNRQTQDLQGSFGGRMFQRFGSHLALQTQGQFEFQNYSDRLDLDQLLLKLAGQNPFPRDQRVFTNYSSREFQLDVGPVLRFGNAQFSVMQSLRYVKRGDFDQGGMLGQFFFNAGYVLKDWGQIGVFATKANLDQSVVKSVQFNQVFFEETYLKIADQAGLNFQLGPRWLPGYFEGTIGYLNTTWAKGAAGGTVRYVAPWPNKKFSLTAEVGYNEGFVRSGESSLRVAGGFRLGNWSKPTDFTNEKGPVPVIVPAIRYETLTRIVRRGNDAPVANAGPDINNVDPGSLVTLDGRGSSDPDSDPITYSWIQVSGPAMTLSNPVSATPSFQTGNFGDNYTFKLIVCDNFGLCSDASKSTACPASGTSTDACMSVTVRKAPLISSFTATPAQVDVGQCSLLSWNTTNADHVTLAPGIGEVPLNGSRSVCPATTTKYTLTAYSGTFPASSEVTVSVRSAQIVTFAAVPAQINGGDCSTLSWKVQNAVRVSIAPDLGDVALEGSRSVCPKVTTTYTLTAFSADSTTVTQNVSVTVNSPLIQTFSATPPNINLGESSTLTWKVLSAVKVTIEPGLGEVPLEGSRSVSPTATTKYTLTAFSADNKTVTQDVQVTVNSPQVISFTADASNVCPSNCTTLRWSTSSAARVVISPTIGEVPLQGSRQVCPTSTTTYTLTAFAANSGQTTTASVQVTIKPLPTITQFSASKTSILAGESVQLSWTTQDADTVILTPPGQSVSPSGSMVVAPTSTQQYNLTAKNACSQITQSITIRVTPAPRILSFTADASNMCPSNCTTLRWSTSSAARVVISPNVGEVPLQGSRQVCPTITTTYTLTAFAVSPGQTATASVLVTIKPLPTITQFSASKTSILAGESVQLSWTTQDADTVTLTPPGRNVSLSGSIVVAPRSTQRYDLTAKNACNQVTQSITINVRTPVPGISSFTAMPPQCLSGQCSQLNWQVSNAQSVSLTNDGTGDVKDVTGQSTLQVCPTISTTYTLKACNSAGQCVSADAMVTVIVQGPPSIDKFQANPEQISAGGTSILSWVVGGAEQVTLYNTDDGTATPVASVVSSWPVSPKHTAIYWLVAVNRFASNVTANLTVTVK